MKWTTGINPTFYQITKKAANKFAAFFVKIYNDIKYGWLCFP